MRTWKMVPVALTVGLGCVLALAFGAGATGATANDQIPEYVGSQACLGCHTDHFSHWSETAHANDVVQLVREKDFPAAISTAPPDLQAELQKAQWLAFGERFLARSPETGHLTYLNVQWDAAAGQYKAYSGGADFDARCASCHSTNWDAAQTAWAEPGVGCEACHGPGREHILGKGDRSKIVWSFDSSTCLQCHTGARHGTNWEVSAHATSTAPVIRNENHEPDPNGTPYKDSCFECHSADGFVAKLKGESFSATENHPNNQPVGCAACHDPHGNGNPEQLRQSADQLCLTCHSAGLPETGITVGGRVSHHVQAEFLWGYGAAGGVTATKGLHSDVSCVECHMVGGDHSTKIAVPTEAATGAQDSCTKCHSDSTPESRKAYLDAWQRTTASMIEAANKDVAVIEQAIAGNPNLLNEEQALLFNTAKANLTYVQEDRSQGAHNFEYAVKVLNSVSTQLKQVRQAIGR